MTTKIIQFFIVAICISCLLSCQSSFSFGGHWKVAEVKIFDGYHNESNVNLSKKDFSYDTNNVETSSLMTQRYKDSILFLMTKCYLRLKDDSTFQLEDHGFLTQGLSDSLWQGQKSGKWSINLEKSFLTLYQFNQISKQFKIIDYSANSLIIGELSAGEPKQITETTYTR